MVHTSHNKPPYALQVRISTSRTIEEADLYDALHGILFLARFGDQAAAIDLCKDVVDDGSARGL